MLQLLQSTAVLLELGGREGLANGDWQVEMIQKSTTSSFWSSSSPSSSLWSSSSSSSSLWSMTNGHLHQHMELNCLTSKILMKLDNIFNSYLFFPQKCDSGVFCCCVVSCPLDNLCHWYLRETWYNNVPAAVYQPTQPTSSLSPKMPLCSLFCSLSGPKPSRCR